MTEMFVKSFSISALEHFSLRAFLIKTFFMLSLRPKHGSLIFMKVNSQTGGRELIYIWDGVLQIEFPPICILEASPKHSYESYS